jgi:hypothetical protein
MCASIMGAAADRIGGQADQQLRAEAHGRTLAITCALITLVRAGRSMTTSRPCSPHACTIWLSEPRYRCCLTW